MALETPTSYCSVEHVLKGERYAVFVAGKRVAAKKDFKEALALYIEWRYMNPWKFTSGSPYALELVRQMICTCSCWLIYTGKPLEGNDTLETLYRLLNESPPHRPSGLFPQEWEDMQKRLA